MVFLEKEEWTGETDNLIISHTNHLKNRPVWAVFLNVELERLEFSFWWGKCDLMFAVIVCIRQMVSIHLRRGRKQGCPKVLVILWIFCSEYISRMCGVIVAVALELAGPAIASPGSNYWAAPLLLLLLDTSPSHLGIYTFHGDFLFTFFFVGAN